MAGPAAKTPVAEDRPPWDDVPPPPVDEERPPLPEEPALERDIPTPEEYISKPVQVPVAPPVQQPVVEAGNFWPSFVAGLKGKVSPSVMPYFNNPDKVTGTWKPGVLTLWVESEFTKTMLNKPMVVEPLTQAAQARFGGPARVEFKVGKAPKDVPAAPSQPAAASSSTEDALNALLAFGEQFDNIVIQ